MLSCLRCNAIFERQITLDEHILRTHPNFIAFVISKIHECTLCAFKTTRSGCFKEHLLEHPEILRTCAICPAEFKSKRSLDDHILRNHPNSIASVTYKIHECTLCTFKTTRSGWFQEHLLKHPGTISNYKFFTCTHCNMTFKTKTSLDNHVIKKHPNSTSSVTNKIHRCTECNYKTTKSTDLKKHSLKHTEKILKCTKCTYKTTISSQLDNHLIKKHLNFISSVTNKIHKCTKCSYKTTISSHFKSHLSRHSKNMLSCLPCNRTFERQITLNEHILRTHPNFIAFITSKIHECTLCAFKTTRSDCFKDHLLKHPEANTNYKFRTCAHCNVAFKKKVSLDNHMLNKHPNFISSVTHKIHKCTECNYRTTMSNHLKRHLLKHTETPTNHKLWTCTLCSAGFNSKRSLDDHILRNHPHSIAFVTYKIHECTLCTFKTTRSDWFQKHLLKHPGTISNYKFFTCRHCNTTFKTKTLLDNHVIKKHPNSTSSVTNKIHRCTECNYKTTKSTDLKKHSLKHTEIPDTRLLSTCAFCPAGFKSKRSLDQHIVKKHPNSIASVTEKILKCRKCTYKTTISSHLKSHLLNHSKAPA
nr:unnamed protein product [Callosobruchus chinensis]